MSGRDRAIAIDLEKTIPPWGPGQRGIDLEGAVPYLRGLDREGDDGEMDGDSAEGDDGGVRELPVH